MRVRCVACWKVGRGRKPRGGDGTFYYPPRHYLLGEPCQGMFEEAEWCDAQPSQKASQTSPADTREGASRPNNKPSDTDPIPSQPQPGKEG